MEIEVEPIEYAQLVRSARSALANWSWGECRRDFNEQLSLTESPQMLAALPAMTAGCLSWHEAIILSQESEAPEAAKTRIHLVWRYMAFRWKLYIDRATELANADSKNASRNHGIATIDFQDLNAILMTMAYSAAIRQHAVADWFGTRCIEMISNREQIIDEGSWTTGPVEPFLIELFCRWKKIASPIEFAKSENSSVFISILENWESEAKLSSAVWDLCELCAKKRREADLPNDDMVFGLNAVPFRELPVVVLFLRRIRNDLGSPDLQVQHSLMDTPLVRCANAFVDFTSKPFAQNEYIDTSLNAIRSVMPAASVPWEE